MNVPKRQVRAAYDADTITVYQAYPPAIADAALRAGRFVPPFKRERMTWVKPSFCWMMYRSGWATKPGQERVLAVRMSRAGFERALGMAALSHFDPTLHADAAAWAAQKSDSPVRVQWDPERTPSGSALQYRSLQVGIGGAAVDAYVDEWVVRLEDITDRVVAWRGELAGGGAPELPEEVPYALPVGVAARIRADEVMHE
ncbi:uncharacterized protein DUF4291 [Promicromonospora sp. AC04]|uniref:DUF4291 domain-containing protein n=1 Tax=Promicromonospora sp. AC04 TaxID=2135723 RepID=UPI000D3CA56A|nr:DUF4291 domain-containing protein [Promicromonospora sp. AC04]PUB19847.1 uncharacterized protein DUF4291 [Promicromonospora sp. AC04]